MMLHTNSLSLSLSLSPPFLKSQTQLCEALIIQAAAAPTTQIHDKNAKVDRKKKKKKKNPLKTHKTQPHSNRPSLTHSLTHSFHKNEIPLQISCCECCFLLQRHTQWPEKKYSREHDLLQQGKYKESRRTQILQQKPNKKKKTETKKTLDKERSKSFEKQKKKANCPHPTKKINNKKFRRRSKREGKGRASSHDIKCRGILQNNESL
jgi:hypothetical protein